MNQKIHESILEIQDFENNGFWKFKILKILDFGIQDFENTGSGKFQFSEIPEIFSKILDIHQKVFDENFDKMFRPHFFFMPIDRSR